MRALVLLLLSLAVVAYEKEEDVTELKIQTSVRQITGVVGASACPDCCLPDFAPCTCNTATATKMQEDRTYW
jgi:hypothetical protein